MKTYEVHILMAAVTGHVFDAEFATTVVFYVHANNFKEAHSKAMSTFEEQWPDISSNQYYDCVFIQEVMEIGRA